jgi:predicted nucleotide-binding protein
LNTKNEEKDKQINIHLQENAKLKADAEKQRAMMSQMEISIRQQLTGQFEIQLKAQKDAVAKLQLEINNLKASH